MLDFPPKPRLVFRVGVIGHRPNRLDPNKIEELKQSLRELLLVIREATQCARNQGPGFASEGKAEATLRIISPLAEGTDRLAAQVALDLGFELQCPMPFPQVEVENDFRPPKAVHENALSEFRQLLERAKESAQLVTFEMDGSRENEEGAYSATGRVVLNQSDVLLAVWDGKPAAGAGGTVETLHDGLKYLVPIVWIDAAEPRNWQLLRGPQELDRKERERDRLNREKTDGAKHDARCIPDLQPTAIRDLRNEVRRVLDSQFTAVSAISAPHAGEGDRTSLAGYLRERRPTKNWGFLWKPFRDFFNAWKPQGPRLQIPIFEDVVTLDWMREEKKTGFGTWINSQLLPYYAWSDKLADFYADAYRSSFVAAFLLGGFAVLFALLSTVLRSPERSEEFSFVDAFLVTMELVMILFIFLVISLGRRKIWHGRWLNYRLVAELIRHIRFVAPLGAGHPIPRLSPYLSEYGNPAQTWMYWYARAIEREIGLPSARLDADYLKGYTAFLQELIDGQIDFHRTTQQRSVNIDRHLRIASELLLGGTLIACILHLSLDLRYGLHIHLGLNIGSGVIDGFRQFLTVCAAVLPAFGAAFAAIRDQGEFHRLGMRAGAMAGRLEQARFELSQIQADPSAVRVASPPKSIALADLAQRVVQLMIDEVLDWRVVFLDRPLETRA
jgi:hypothetical protein